MSSPLEHLAAGGVTVGDFSNRNIGKTQKGKDVSDATEQSLVELLGSIELSQPATDGGESAFAVEELQFRVIEKLMTFLAANASILPSKETLLAALSRAIDAAFLAINKPLIASLLKPIVKARLLEMAGSLYDSILNPRIEV